MIEIPYMSDGDQRYYASEYIDPILRELEKYRDADERYKPIAVKVGEVSANIDTGGDDSYDFRVPHYMNPKTWEALSHAMHMRKNERLVLTVRVLPDEWTL